MFISVTLTGSMTVIKHINSNEYIYRESNTECYTKTGVYGGEIWVTMR